MKLECPICLVRFSSPARIPVVFSCGHTICEECAQGLPGKTCPTCRNEFDKYVPNYSLMSLMEAAKPRERKIFEKIFKISIVGESGVGKSSILNGFMGKFDQRPIPTIGADLRLISEIEKGNRYKFQLWDTGGQEKYRTITNMHYKNSDLIILAYSLNDAKSFYELSRYWIDQVKYLAPDSHILILGNKLDLERRVSDVDIKNMCKTYGCLEAKISCKQRINLEAVWELIRGTLINQSLSASLNVQQQPLEQSQKLSKYRSSKDINKSCC